jgi:multiple sugar transport system substrate-binding protein
MFTRRQALSIGLLATAATGLAACGPNASGGGGSNAGGGGGGDDSASMRFTWWGNNVRDELTRKAIDAYQDTEDGVEISGENGDWQGYWDKLATQTAGGDLPDIIQMDEKYLMEYGSRGTLLDLAKGGLDTSTFDDEVVKTGEVPDKGLLAICAGINAAVLLVNPEVFDAAGVDVPDDTTWTWDDFFDIAQKITENTDEGTFGSQQLGLVQATFQVHMRQLGKDQYTTDGVGFGADDATKFFEIAKKLQDTKASPGADMSVEEAGQSLDQTMFATGKLGMAVAWSNQVVAFDDALDGKVKLLRLPSMTGKAADAGLWYKSGQYFSVSAKSTNTKGAVAFVDWLVNSEDAGKILLAERGVPGNLDVRDAIVGGLTDSDTKAVDFIDAIKDEIGDSPAITPQGGGDFEDMLKRAAEDLLFGRTDPAKAGKALFDELSGAITV